MFHAPGLFPLETGRWGGYLLYAFWGDSIPLRRIHPQRSGRTEGERLKTAAVTEIISSLRAQTDLPFAPFCLRRPPAQAERVDRNAQFL